MSNRENNPVGKSEQLAPPDLAQFHAVLHRQPFVAGLNVARLLAAYEDAARENVRLRALVARVNARAEADMLSGNPITGAHHRALEAELKRMEQTDAG